ncbi:hypothetical protein NC653_012628 [Populus alba x Populus x berolinensis]|uniref:VQ domain-containing protein n=1 Tax=Populus alba x Populus x berolinensis TaxID=444605 RepID=A0AAD6QSR3_9ROSI|nr:hypothetical protein NC653_012628 [Populus alba x Populus x berolinensis]
MVKATNASEFRAIVQELTGKDSKVEDPFDAYSMISNEEASQVPNNTPFLQTEDGFFGGDVSEMSFEFQSLCVGLKLKLMLEMRKQPRIKKTESERRRFKPFFIEINDQTFAAPLLSFNFQRQRVDQVPGRPGPRKVGQRKTISGQRKTLSSQRKTLSGQRKTLSSQRKTLSGQRKTLSSQF